MDKPIGQESVDGASHRGPGSQATREKLTSAAAELIAEVGWGRVTTRAVAERAGLPHGAVSYHFRGKQELLIEACIHAFSASVESEELMSMASVEDLIGAIGHMVDPEVGPDAMLTRLMFEAMREAERDDTLRERLGSMVTEYRQAVVDVVRADQERGAIPATAPAEGVAVLMTAIGDGLFLHALIDPELDVASALTALRAMLAGR